MVRRIILWKLAAAEKDLSAPADSLRHILRISLRAFLKFVKIMPLARYRRALPPCPYHVARIVAARDEDCATCVQIEIGLAKKAGVPADILRAVLDRRPGDLPEAVADVYHFTEAVVEATWEEATYRERIRRRHAEEALVELAMAIAACRVFPITQRALGYGISCARTEIRA